MLFDTEKMKTRLKELRKEHGWTQVTVIDAINRKYPELYKQRQKEKPDSDIISEGTIKQYESYGGKISGMSVETLCLFADLYGVSVEYILGLTDIRTPDADIKGISKKIGLSEAAIEKQLEHPHYQDLLGLIIKDKYYLNLMGLMHNFLMNEFIHESERRKIKKEIEEHQNGPYHNDDFQSVRIDGFERERYMIVRQFEALLDDIYDEKSEEYSDKRTNHSGCPAEINEDGSFKLLDDPQKYKKDDEKYSLNIVKRPKKAVKASRQLY